MAKFLAVVKADAEKKGLFLGKEEIYSPKPGMINLYKPANDNWFIFRMRELEK